MNKKFLSIVMAVVMAASSIMPFVVFAEDEAIGQPETTTQAETQKNEETTLSAEEAKIKAQQELEAQKKSLEESYKLALEKLELLEKDSKGTEEYINTLDQKIGYMNEQLTVLEAENQAIQSEIDALKPQIDENEKQLNTLSKQVDDAKNEIERLEEKFESVYEAYCIRLRVMYISGNFNILTALLTCNDISSFLTRYEMIKSVAKSDTELLQEVNEKTEEIITKKDGLDESLSKYEAIKLQYDEQKAQLEQKQKIVEQNSQSIADKKIALANDRAESDRLLAQLTAQNQQYTEFRNEDKELIEAVENEIQALISGLKSAEEVTTAVSSGDNHAQSTAAESGGKADVFSKNDAVLNMTYPVPGRYSISAGFPNYSSGQYHGGIDFPCPTGSKVVAAQDGIVMTVKRLNYSYGYYVMIYHGTDSKGRSVVTLYAHNSSILVSAGDTVKRGQQIAKSGSTGNSTGPHCHFEVRFDGGKVNPTFYLSK